MEAPAPAPVKNIGGRREPSTDPVKAQGILNSVTKKSNAAAKLWPQRWYFYSKIKEIQEEEAQKVGMTAEEYRAALQLHSSQSEPQHYPVTVDPSPSPLPPTSADKTRNTAEIANQQSQFETFPASQLNGPTYEAKKADQLILYCAKAKLSTVKSAPITIRATISQLVNVATGKTMIGRRALCPLERFGRLVKTDRDYPLRPPLRPGQIYDPYKQTVVFLGSVDGDPISYKLPPARCEMTDEMWARPQQLTVSPLGWENLERILNETE